MTAKKEATRPDTIRVRATQTGYIQSVDPGEIGKGDVLREVGDVWTLGPREIAILNAMGKPELDDHGRLKTRTLTAQDQFSPNWMMLADEDEPLQSTGAQEAINRQLAELNQRGVPRTGTED